jgi:pimeloyl-ACP methyl ester carboxylesterase
MSVAVTALRTLNTALGQDAPDLLRVVDALPDATGRAAFIRSLRAVADWRGQVITMLDRCYLTQGMPTLLIWGTRDAVIPVGHAHRAHAAMPGSQLELFEGAGHFPFHTDPERFVQTVEQFLASTTPATWNLEQWRQLLRTGRHTAAAPLDAEEADLAERSAT